MLQRITAEVGKQLVGKEESVKQVLIAMLAGGHVLIEDLPGLGKTTLAKAVAGAVSLQFQRIQFTPDLMPSDLMGVTIFDKERQQFNFQQGPIFTNLLLADEINRTSPKTQSSLLEAMEENQVTVDGKTYALNKPFMVIATENPIELQGTFPLPEAQLDRFMLRISLGYPTLDEEVAILDLKERREVVGEVIRIDELLAETSKVEAVYVDEALKHYMARLCQKTREHAHIKLGASPRALVHMFQAVRAKAYLEGRDYVVGSDITSLFHAVVAHRLILKGEAVYRGVDVNQVLTEILNDVDMPRVKR